MSPRPAGNAIRRQLVVGLFCLSAGLLGACHQRVPDDAAAPAQAPATGTAQARAAARHVALAEEYFRRGRLAEAESERRLAQELDPSLRVASVPLVAAAPAGEDFDQRVDAGLRRAEQHYRASEEREAELGWNGVLELDPGNAIARAGLARLAAEAYQSDPDRAYDRMTASLYTEGLRAFRRENWETAEGKFAEAAKLNPDQPQVKTYLARSQAELARLRDREHGRALAVQARDAEARAEWRQARALWQESARLQPPAEGADAGLSRTAQALRTWAQGAVAQADRLRAAGRAREAWLAYQDVLQVFPDDPLALAGRRSARAALGEQQRGQDARSQAQSHAAAAAAAAGRGEWATATAAWEQAVAADPDQAEWKAKLAEARNHDAEARAGARRRAQARYEDGLAAYQRGELDAALAAWKETLELDPEHAKARANLRRLEQDLH